MTQPQPRWSLRDLVNDDLADILDLDAQRSARTSPRDFLDELIVPELELDRFIGVRDAAAGDRLVASACILSKDLTFPGRRGPPGGRRRPGSASARAGGAAACCAAMMTEQLHGLHDDRARRSPS